MVADARANNIHLTACWAYFAPWTSADGGTRKGPIRDLRYWRDYVRETVTRYRDDIKYWEVWNEFNGSFYAGREGRDKVKDYADLVAAAYDTAKDVDPLFVPYGTKELHITIVAARVAPDKPAGMNLCYESALGYRGAPGWWTIPAGDGWHENTWKVTDANFVGQWGWNFRFDAISSPNEFLIKEVRVSKAGAPAE